MKYISTTTAAILLAFSSVTYAGSGNYFGASFGNTEVDTGISTSTATLDEEDSGFKILYGKKLQDWFAFEIAFHDFGESSLTGTPGDLFTFEGVTYQFVQNATVAVNGEAFAFSGLFSNEFTPSLSGFGRIGLSRWESEGTAGGVTIKSDGTDLLYGVGLQYDVNQTIGIRGEYEVHEDLDFLSVGFITRF